MWNAQEPAYFETDAGAILYNTFVEFGPLLPPKFKVPTPAELQTLVDHFPIFEKDSERYDAMVSELEVERVGFANQFGHIIPDQEFWWSDDHTTVLLFGSPNVSPVIAPGQYWISGVGYSVRLIKA